MRILHTADWHLGDRLGRIDRTDDLRLAVERVGAYCQEEYVDILLVAGDLFSELARPEGLRETIEHWQKVFHDFLHRGGTILTLTGNHDNENFCRTLTRAMSLAAPLNESPGTLLPPGRLYLAADPTLLRIKDPKEDFEVQFILMPYPTPSRYLRGEASQKYVSPEEKNRKLLDAFETALRTMQQHPRFDGSLPTILSAHISVSGATLGPSLFRIAERDDVVLDASVIGDEFTYVALGHIHKPQALGGRPWVRYSGSIERMDLGEKEDAKTLAIIDIGPQGRLGEPQLFPLKATPIYEVVIHDPSANLASLRAKYADAEEDLVNLHVTYTAGKDSLEAVLDDLEAIFPRWYARDWQEVSELGASLVGADHPAARSFVETVRSYVEQELLDHPEEDRIAVSERLEELFRRME